MAKILEIDMEREEELCDIGKALSSPIRIQILKLLYEEALIIGEIAKKLEIPTSSAAMHLRVLEQAQLVRTEEQPGTRGKMKLCSRKVDMLNIDLLNQGGHVNKTASVEMPLGTYSECKILPTCGIWREKGFVGMEDKEYSFFLPERVEAQLLWSAGGYVEYKFANTIPKRCVPKRIFLTMEICSEAPGYREDWKSDITVWLNGVECGTWRCPGDFGARRGRLTPESYPNGSTQYGLLTSWQVSNDGAYVNEKKVSDVTVKSLRIMDNPFVNVRVGNKEDAKYIGGFNIFGKNMGDYDQGIIMSLEYESEDKEER